MFEDSAPLPTENPTAIQDFGDYEILEEIGGGAQGIIYKARQKSLNRNVALKMIRFGEPSKQIQEEQIRRFRTEAKAMGQLRHPNIVTIHDAGEHQGQHYFSMDYIEGKNLSALATPLPSGQAAKDAKIIAEAMHYAHGQHILHRDLKPSNILVDAHGQLHVADFGLAKFLKPDQKASMSAFVGTVAYMSPEQAMGRKVDRGSDVYSIGAILYELLCGHPPFLAASQVELIPLVVNNRPVPPRLLNPRVPKDLETICLKCLEKLPSARYSSAEKLAEDLDRFLKGEPIIARRPTVLKKVWYWSRRRPVRAAAIALTIVGIIVGSVWREISNRNTRIASRMQRANERLSQGMSADGLADAAQGVRGNRNNLLNAGRLLAAMSQRNFPQPTILPITHGDIIKEVRFSPDGQRLLTASSDGTAGLWDVKTGRPIGSPLRHEAKLEYGQFSPNGKVVLTASSNTVWIWDVESSRLLAPPIMHANTIRSIEFSADGRFFITAAGVIARIRETSTGKETGILLRHKYLVYSAQFSPDGLKVITACDDRRGRIWDARTGEPVLKALNHDGPVRFAQFSPDGERIATASGDQTARIWSAETGEPLTQNLRHRDTVQYVQFSPDGQRIVTASVDKTARIWDATTGQPLGDSLVHSYHVTAAEFSPDGLHVLTVSEDATARIWDGMTGEPVCEPIRHQTLVRDAHFSPDGQRVVTAASTTAQIWDVRLGSSLPIVFMHQRNVERAFFSKDGRNILTKTKSRTLEMWDAHTGRLLQKPSGISDRHGAGWSVDGSLAMIASGSNVYVWDSKLGKMLEKPLEHDKRVTTIQFSRDGRFACTTTDVSAFVWDPRTGARLTAELKHESGIKSVALSGDASLLAVACADGTAWIWRCREGKRSNSPLIREGSAETVLFSPDDGRLLVIFNENSARIWNVQDQTPLTPVFQHDQDIMAVDFSPDGKRLVTGSMDNTARIWDGFTGRAWTERLQHRGPVRSVTFSLDGTKIATASFDKTVRIWNAHTGQPLTEPFLHPGEVHWVHISPDNERLVTVCADNSARIWWLPFAPGAAPAWLANLAEALAGKRINEPGLTIAIPSSEFIRLKQQLLQSSGSDFYGRWARWFLSDRASRELSPNFQVTIPDSIANWITQGTVDAIREAVALSPTNVMVLLKLALKLNTLKLSVLEEVGWLTKRALQLDPNNSDAFLARADFLVRRQMRDEALVLLDRAVVIQPLEPDLWNFKGLLLESTNRLEEAHEAYSEAIRLSEMRGKWPIEAFTRYRMNRFHVLMRLNREADARSDFLATIPARDVKTAASAIDLSDFYNVALTISSGELPGSDLLELRPGSRILAGVEFDVRGIIQLEGNDSRGPSPQSRLVKNGVPVYLWPYFNGKIPQRYPTEVRGIKVGQRCHRLHFLHAANHTSGTNGTEVGALIVAFKSGQSQRIPIRLGYEVFDWWSYQQTELPNSVVAWEGTNAAVRAWDPPMSVRIFKTTWDNSRPEDEVSTIDFVSEKTRTAPFLIAITADDEVEDKSEKPSGKIPSPPPAPLSRGSQAPVFQLPLLGGGELNLLEQRGSNVVLLQFWMSACDPCRSSLPLLVELARRYAGKGLIVYTINRVEQESRIRDFLKNFELELPTALDSDATVSSRFNVNELPLTVIVGREGAIEAIYEGHRPDLKERIEGKIASLLSSTNRTNGASAHK